MSSWLDSPTSIGAATGWWTGAHDHLTEADVTDTGLVTDAYDLVVCSLVDEHLPWLAPLSLYREAFRLATACAGRGLIGHATASG